MKRNFTKQIGAAALGVLGLVNIHSGCGKAEKTDASSSSGHIATSATTGGAGGEGGRGGMGGSAGMGGASDGGAAGMGGMGGAGQVSSSSTGGAGGISGAGGQGGFAGMGGTGGSSGSGGCNDPDPCHGPGTLEITHDITEFDSAIKYFDLPPDPNTTVACSSAGTDPCQKIIFIDAGTFYDIPLDLHVDFIPDGEVAPNPACHFDGIFLYHILENQIPYHRVEKAPQLTHDPAVIPDFLLSPPPNLICGNYPMLSIKMDQSSCGQPHIIQQVFP